MSTHQNHQPKPSPLSDDEVAEFLRDNPEFFERQPELLAELSVPHECGEAISLVERQVSLLREQNHSLRRKLMDLVQTARDNSSTHERVHRLTLRLLEARGRDEVLLTVQELLRNEFYADAVRFFLFTDGEIGEAAAGARLVPRSDRGLQAFAEFLELARPLCGRLRASQLEYLFGDTAAMVGSSVLIPLSDDRPMGMLAIAAQDPQRFHPGMGTMVLAQLGELIGRALSLQPD